MACRRPALELSLVVIAVALVLTVWRWGENWPGVVDRGIVQHEAGRPDAAARSFGAATQRLRWFGLTVGARRQVAERRGWELRCGYAGYTSRSGYEVLAWSPSEPSPHGGLVVREPEGDLLWSSEPGWYDADADPDLLVANWIERLEAEVFGPAREGRYDEALSALLRRRFEVSAFRPSNRVSWIVSTVHCEAVIRHAQGQYSDAEELYSEAIEQYSDEGDRRIAHRHLALLLGYLGKTDEAALHRRLSYAAPEPRWSPGPTPAFSATLLYHYIFGDQEAMAGE